MTPMTASPQAGGARTATTTLALVGLACTTLFLCFCSFLPAALFVSFVFNALVLGANLFSALAQEREKRTIDALRLTQLSSLDILLLKSRRELRLWGRGNVVLTGLMLLAGLQGGEPVLWVFSGAAALAAGGLLSIALALAVSTTAETTSTAVVRGWVGKGVWLVGLPLLDQVVEAVFVTREPVVLFRYLDPAWVALKVSEVSFFVPESLTLVSLWMGILASLAVAALVVWRSSLVIDSSFESAATLEDRNRHRAYSAAYPGGLEKNVFFVRELAWQLRTGAGRWPGYAVFFTLFLAPFLYGVAQSQKIQAERPTRVIRQEVLQQVVVPPISETNAWQKPGGHHGCVVDSVQPAGARDYRYHSGLCFSRLLGLPVNRTISLEPGQVSVVNSNGRVEQVSMPRTGQVVPRQASGSALTDSNELQYQLGRGLLTGLLLTIIYLFVRGGAFMASAVTGEKERRSWDQIALTGATAEAYIGGKLAGVLSYPLRQILVASPALLLFVLFDVMTLSQCLLAVLVLVTSFVAAAALGVAMSTLRSNSHQAQGSALLAAAVLLLLPLTPSGWLALLLVAAVLVGRMRLSSGGSFCLLGSLLLGTLVGGPMVSPLAAVLALCGSSVGTSSLVFGLAGATGALAWSALSMVFFAGLFYRIAVAALEDGGSMRV